MKNKLSTASILLTLIGTSAFATNGANSQTLMEEAALLFESHPQLARARNDVRAAEEGVGQAFADFLPELALRGDYGYAITDSPPLRSSGRGTLETDRSTATLELTQKLFTGFRVSADHEAAKISKSIADAALDSTEQNLMFDAASAYLNVLRNIKLQTLAAANEQTIRHQLNLEDERVERGAGIAVDVLFAKARLQIARERRVAFEGDLLNSISRYVQLFDHPPETAEMVVPPSPVGLLPATVEEAVAIALAENPTVVDSELNIDLVDQQKRSAKSAFFPEVDIVGELNAEDDNDGVVGVRRDASILLRAKWDLFSGFRTQAAVAQASFRYAASKDNRSFVARRVTEDVQMAWDDLRTARKRVELLQNAVNIAVEVHEARKKLLEVGKETVINVLDAENEVFSARIAATDAAFDAQIASYRVLLAVGRLGREAFG